MAHEYILLCPGQGCQKPGMGNGALEIPQVAETVACASDVFGMDVVALLRDADADEINQARNAQIAIATMTIGVGKALFDAGFTPRWTIGFSLGQISALALCGVLSLEDTFALLDVRATAMQEAAQARPGCMSAIMGAEPDAVERLCQENAGSDVLVPANYNCPGQIVISGDVAAVERAEEAYRAQGGKAIRLATAGAFHSPIMQPAADTLYAYCQKVKFAAPTNMFVCNTDAKPFDVSKAADRLSAHLTHPVHFMQSVDVCVSQGANATVEVGYGKVLTNLVRKCDKTLEREKVSAADSLASFIETLN